MLNTYAEEVLIFMESPNKEKKNRIVKLYNDIISNKDISKKDIESVKSIFSYVDWVLKD